MDAKTQKQLEEAKEHFYALRLVEAYNILRRYFDRIPFQQEDGHAELIGIFARTLAELGKEYELKFYMGEFEKILEKTKNPLVGYQLATIYCFGSEPRIERAKSILNGILRERSAKELHAKIKMRLAWIYDEQGDRPSCRQIIESISEPLDEQNRYLLDIWRAKVRRDANNFNEAERLLLQVLAQVNVDSNWYAYFSAKMVLANLYLKRGEVEKSRPIAVELKSLFSNRRFKSAAIMIKELENNLSENHARESIRVTESRDGSSLTFSNKTLRFKTDTSLERLILLLAKKGFLNKPAIVRALYSRQYEAERDDKLIHYHIHSLRKRLMEIGLPSKVIASVGDGYKLTPSVEFGGGIN